MYESKYYNYCFIYYISTYSWYLFLLLSILIKKKKTVCIFVCGCVCSLSYSHTMFSQDKQNNCVKNIIYIYFFLLLMSGVL